MLFHCFLVVAISAILASASPSGFTPLQRCNFQNQSAPLPTPTYGSAGGIFSACTEQIIHGSLADVYNTILNFGAYPLWNTFVVAVSLPGTVSEPSDVYVNMGMGFITSGLIPGVNTTSNEIITVLSTPSQHNTYEGKAVAISAWRWDDGLGGLGRAEHPNLLTDLGDGTVRYVSYETYYGVVGAPVLLLKTQLQEAFERQGKNLKDWVERQH